MTAKDLTSILQVGVGLAGMVGQLVTQIVQIRSLAQQAGATDAQLDALEVRLSAAIAARQAEQSPLD
jgi:hypothetical protein